MLCQDPDLFVVPKDHILPGSSLFRHIVHNRNSGSLPSAYLLPRRLLSGIPSTGNYKKKKPLAV